MFNNNDKKNSNRPIKYDNVNNLKQPVEDCQSWLNWPDGFKCCLSSQKLITLQQQNVSMFVTNVK